ncbi:MAG: CHAT domain-containing tetratricopeptide repeat protein [Bacteroidota bacterium]
MQKAIELKEELTVLDTAIVLAQADSLFQLGEVYLTTNNKDSSLYYHEQALSLREKAGRNDQDLFDSYVKVGGFYLDDFKYDVADTYFEKAQSIVQHKGVPIEEEIKFLLDLSSIKLNLKDIPTAVSLLNRVKKLAEAERPEDKLIQAKIKHSLGNTFYYSNQFEQAILNYNSASSLYNQVGDFRRMGILFTSIGMAYSLINQHDLALANFTRSIQNHLKWTHPESYQLALVYLQKAFTLDEIGEFDSAQYYFQLNLKIRRKLFGEKDANTFGAKFSLAQFYESQHKYDSAVKYSQESLISLVANFNDPNILVNPVPGSTEFNVDLVMGLVGKAETLVSLSEFRPNSGYGDLALKTYFLADSIFTVFRRTLSFDDPQLRELEVGHIPYDNMIELAFKLHNQTGERKYLEMSFEIIERSRSVLLESALNRARMYDTIGGDKVRRENELLKQRSEILRQLSWTTLTDGKSDSLSEALLLVNNSFSELQKELERENPNYFNVRYDRKKVNMDDIQRLLKDRNSHFAQFLWSTEKIYLLAISPTEIATKIIIQNDSFKTALTDFVVQVNIKPEESIKQENFNRFIQSSFSLYRTLVGDVFSKHSTLRENGNLIISADGQLATFPFEALITALPRSNEVNYQLPYLIEQCPVSYAYSSGIFLRQSKHDRVGSKLLALGFAGEGSVRSHRNGLVNLPGTEKEINSIRQVMKNNTNKYYLLGEASEAMFKKQVTDFDIVHLAMHGMADSSNVLESKLIFRTELDTIEDGSLYAHELYSLNLNKLDLAVLSACESGIGKQQAGEGVMSIARGFAYAGCPSLIISLWKIDDRTSAQVMGDFYRHLSYGEEINKALTNAKTDYIAGASEFNSHPAYWAAFLQVGDTRAIDMKGPNFTFWLIALIILIAGLAIAIRIFRKKTGTNP